jgi:hypothetical protein
MRCRRYRLLPQLMPAPEARELSPRLSLLRSLLHAHAR